MKRRTFSAEFKAKIVLELLRGEKDLTVIASENEIAPNQIRNWKAEFPENAAAAFDDKKSENLKAELKEKESETDTLLGYQTPAENYYPVLLGMTA
jgi:putative transposase